MMDESELRIVESATCVRCGASCEAALSDDLLRFACPNDGTRYVLTIRAPDDVAVPADEDPLFGKTLGPCRIVRRAGSEGGLPLYHGLDVALSQPYSVCVLAGDAAKDRDRLQTFVRAGRYGAAVRHTAFASVTHLAKIPGGVFAVSGALEGQPLERALGPGRMGLREALAVGRALAEALAELHDKQIVHRNIGPKSLYILPNGKPQLRNFAFATGPGGPTDADTVVGQAGYLAPEQATGGDIGPRADLYSLGALLYRMLAGRSPFGGRTAPDTIRLQTSGALPDRRPLELGATPELADLVLRLLAPAPEDRPEDAQAVLDALTVAEGRVLAPAPAAPQAPIAPLELDEAQLSIVEPNGQEPKAQPEPPDTTPGLSARASQDKPLPLQTRSPASEPGKLPEVPTVSLGDALDFDKEPGLKEEPRQAPKKGASPGPVAGRPQAKATAKPRPKHAPSPEPRPGEKPEAKTEAGPETAPAEAEEGVLSELVLEGKQDGDEDKEDHGEHPEVEDVEVVEPFWKRREAKLVVVGGVLALIFGITQLGGLCKKSPAPSATTGAKTTKKKAKGTKPTPQQEAERRAKPLLKKLKKLEEKSPEKLDEIRKQATELRKKFPDTQAAAEAKSILDKLRKRQEREELEGKALEELEQVEDIVLDDARSYSDRFVAASNLIKKVRASEAPEAEAVKRALERADGLLSKMGAAAGNRARKVLNDIKPHLKTTTARPEPAYGPAIAALSGIVADYRGVMGHDIFKKAEHLTQAVTKLAELRAAVRKRFADMKKEANGLLADAKFDEAKEAYKPIADWKLDVLAKAGDPKLAALAKQAEALAADVDREAAAFVRAYGQFLKKFDALVAQCKLAEAEQLGTQAAAEAEKKNQHALLHLFKGKAADAKLMVKALDRAIEGAREAKKEADAKPDKKVVVALPDGKPLSRGRMAMATIGAASREGIVLNGKLTPWGDMPRHQIVSFAEKAKTKPTADERAGLGLLALNAGGIRAAYDQFKKAVKADEEAATKTIRACLGRHAMGFVHIPARTLAPEAEGKKPRDVKGCLLCRFEVTNVEYKFFVDATDSEAPSHWSDDKHAYSASLDAERPVVNITWKQANAYAEWLGLRLLAVDEWENAVRGANDRKYPWGNDFDKGKIHVVSPPSAPSGKKPRRTRKPSVNNALRVSQLVRRITLDALSYPIYHLYGNVREWTSTPASPGTTTRYKVVGYYVKDPRKKPPKTVDPEVCDGAKPDPIIGLRLAWPR